MGTTQRLKNNNNNNKKNGIWSILKPFTSDKKEYKSVFGCDISRLSRARVFQLQVNWKWKKFAFRLRTKHWLNRWKLLYSAVISRFSFSRRTAATHFDICIVKRQKSTLSYEYICIYLIWFRKNCQMVFRCWAKRTVGCNVSWSYSFVKTFYVWQY